MGQRKSLSYPENNCICIGITLRQWSIIISILFAIFTIILSSFSALGLLHTKSILELLRHDIEVERERRLENDSPAYCSNEAKLHASKNVVLMTQNILYIYLWMSWVQFGATVSLIGGVCLKKSSYILLWLTISLPTYLLMISSMIYFDVLSKYYFSHRVALLIVVGCFPFYLIMWKVLFMYYQQLHRRSCVQSPPPTVIKSSNGVTHVITIQMPPNHKPKKIQDVV